MPNENSSSHKTFTDKALTKLKSDPALMKEFEQSPEFRDYMGDFSDPVSVKFRLFVNRKELENLTKLAAEQTESFNRLENSHRNERLLLEQRLHDRELRLQSLSTTLAARESEAAELATLRAQLEQGRRDLEKERNEQKLSRDEEFGKLLKSKTSSYVKEVLKNLEIKATSLGNSSSLWSITGATIVAIGLLFTIISLTNIDDISNLTWPSVSLLAGRAAVFLGMVALGSKYCFNMAQRNFSEGRRIYSLHHNLSFGSLYVETYGATAGWDQVKDAFASWGKGETKTEPVDAQLQINEESLTLLSGTIEQILERIIGKSK